MCALAVHLTVVVISNRLRLLLSYIYSAPTAGWLNWSNAMTECFAFLLIEANDAVYAVQIQLNTFFYMTFVVYFKRAHPSVTTVYCATTREWEITWLTCASVARAREHTSNLVEVVHTRGVLPYTSTRHKNKKNRACYHQQQPSYTLLYALSLYYLLFTQPSNI